MKRELALGLSFFILILCLLPSQAVDAKTTDLRIDYPQSIERGQTFNVNLVIPSGAPETVEVVQVYFKYDPTVFTFNAGASTVLGAASNGSSRQIIDNNGLIAILAWQTPATTAQLFSLSFTTKAGIDGARLTPASFEMVEAPNGSSISKVSTRESGLIDAMTYGNPVGIEIIEPKIEEQKQPEPLPPAVTAAPGDNQIAKEPQQAGAAPATNSSPAAAGEAVEVMGTTVAVVPAPVSTDPPAVQPEQSQPTETKPHDNARPESPLKDEQGRNLYLPAQPLKAQMLPTGFVLKEERILGVDVPGAFSEARQLTLHYLTPQQEAAYYTYDAALQRFKLFDMKMLQNATVTSAAKQPLLAEKSNEGPNVYLVIFLSVVALICLAILIYALSKSIIR